MKKLINRVKYWFTARRHHIDSIFVEQERDGLHLYARVKGKKVKLNIGAISDGDEITDYGMQLTIDRAL